MVRMSQVLEYKLIFPEEEPRELNTYIRGIDKKTLLKLGCHFSMTSKSQQSNKELLSNWFQKDNQKFLSAVWAKVYELEKTKYLTIVNPFSSLRFFELVLSGWDESDIIKNETESEREIFKLYLLLNEEYTGYKDKNVSDSTNELDGKCKFEGMAFANSFVDSDLYNYELNKVIITQFQKAYLLFQELEQNEDFKDLLTSFCNSFNVADWKEYLKKILPMIFPLIKKEKEGNVTINVEQGENFDSSCEFLEKFALSDYSGYDADYDFLGIRSKPMLKIQKGEYLVINPLFLCEKLFKGLYFTLKKLNEDLPKPIKDFKSIYNDKYSEQRLVYSVLGETFAGRYQRYTGEELRNLGISGEPDYYMRNRNKVLIFESKDILIPASITTSGDFGLLKESFLKKLYFDVDHDKHKIKPKAVVQLVRNIEKLLKGEDFIKFDTELNGKSLNIYPVLVLHDALYNALGLNRLLNYWFNRELGKIQKQGFNIRRVRPLVILDIDTMIHLQEAIKKSNCSYDKFIDDYVRDIVNFNPKKARSQEQATAMLQNSLISFSFYLEELDLIKKNWKLPPQFEAYGKDLFS